MQDDEAAKQIHSQFMQMALQLVDGRLDSSQYEDSCRQLLGVHHCLRQDFAASCCHQTSPYLRVVYCAHPSKIWCLHSCQHLCPLHLWARMPFISSWDLCACILVSKGSGQGWSLFQQRQYCSAHVLSTCAQHSRHTFHAVTCHSPTPAITPSLKLNTCLAVGGHADTAQADCVTGAWVQAPTAVPISLND